MKENGSPVRRTAIDRERAVEELARTKARGALDTVLSAASDRNAGVRARVAEGLANFSGRRSREMLLRLLSDRDDMVRLNAAESLGRLRATKAMPLLAKRLVADREVLVRAYCAEALGRLGVAAAKPLLSERLAMESASAVRLRLVEALYRLGERGRWKEALQFLTDDDYHVRSAAAATLEEWLSPTRRVVIVRALKQQLAVEPTVAVAERIRSILRDAQVRRR